MTIKRRLYLSNILMIVIPVMLSIIVGIIMTFIIRGFFNIGKGERLNDENQFYKTVIQIMDLRSEWEKNPDLDVIKEDLDSLIGNNNLNYSLFTVYENQETVYEIGDLSVEVPYLEIVLSKSGEHHYAIDNLMTYSFDIGNYKIVYSENEPLEPYLKDLNQFRRWAFKLLNLLFITVIMLILMTNGFLTRIVINSIIDPLNTLIYGVHQIRDGNLEYRIHYSKNDEFQEICEDFNEMAGHLKDMVNSRQKDDDNRKELIAGISHDLRTPLTSLKGYVIGLEEGIDTTPEIRQRYLSVLRNKTTEIEQLVNQLFLFSKLDIGEFPIYPDITNLRDELTDFVDQILLEYKQKGLDIILEEIPENITLSLDRVQFHNVLVNLFENAVKYGDKEIKQLRIQCKIDDQRIVLRLADNGPGVPPESLDKLFDVFYRVDKARNITSSGSGIGLAISKKIVERMDGEIYAVNGIPEGLAVIITFPIKEEGEDHV